MIIVVIIISLLLRLLPLDFPSFTADEARIAARGYAIATTGKDELGRSFPLLFNSLTDYQLPATSYITALGVMFFGKSDFGARMPFILLGVGLVFLVYKIAQIFSPKKEFWILCGLVTAFSPSLIFLSKIPNESILLTFVITLLFYLLTKGKVNLILVLSAVVFSLLISKFAWFITPPFILLTLMFYRDALSKKLKISITILSFFLSFLALGLFLQVPQSRRSISENNFPIFFEITIKNGIERLRGQGLEAGWTPFLERVLFNKLDYLYVGFLHWLSHLQPAILFGQLDSRGEDGFMSMGAWSKMGIIPLLLGLIYLIKKGTIKDRLLILYPLILTFPSFFIYPNYHQSIISLSLPFMAIVVTFGLISQKISFRIIVISLMILEVIINLSYLDPEIKNAQSIRPGWVKSIVTDGYTLSHQNKVAISDDIVEDAVSFLSWYTQIDPKDSFFDVPSPYKFRQTQISDNLKIIGSDNSFYNCGLDRPTYIFASKRDLEKIQKIRQIKIDKSYKDSLGVDVAFLLLPTICVK